MVFGLLCVKRGRACVCVPLIIHPTRLSIWRVCSDTFSLLLQCIKCLRMWRRSMMSWTMPWVWEFTDYGRTCYCMLCTLSLGCNCWMWRGAQVTSPSVSWSMSGLSKSWRSGGRCVPCRRRHGRTYPTITPQRTGPGNRGPWFVTSTRRCWEWASRKLTAWASPLVRLHSYTFKDPEITGVYTKSRLCLEKPDVLFVR